MLICLTMIIYFFFSHIILIFALCIFVSLLLRCPVVYDVYLFCELYLLSLKIFIFVSFKINKWIKKKKKRTCRDGGLEIERLFYLLCLVDDSDGIDRELMLYLWCLILFILTEETPSPIAQLFASLNHSLKASVPRAEGQDMACIPGTNLHIRSRIRRIYWPFSHLTLCQVYHCSSLVEKEYSEFQPNGTDGKSRVLEAT